MEQGDEDAGAGAAQGVAERNCPAVDVDLGLVQLELHQLDVQLRKALVRLGQKFTQKVIHRLSPAFAWPSGSKSGAITAVNQCPRKDAEQCQT